jgi:hypothetical protein
MLRIFSGPIEKEPSYSTGKNIQLKWKNVYPAGEAAAIVLCR